MAVTTQIANRRLRLRSSGLQSKSTTMMYNTKNNPGCYSVGQLNAERASPRHERTIFESLQKQRQELSLVKSNPHVAFGAYTSRASNKAPARTTHTAAGRKTGGEGGRRNGRRVRSRKPHPTEALQHIYCTAHSLTPTHNPPSDGRTTAIPSATHIPTPRSRSIGVFQTKLCSVDFGLNMV